MDLPALFPTSRAGRGLASGWGLRTLRMLLSPPKLRCVARCARCAYDDKPCVWRTVRRSGSVNGAFSVWIVGKVYHPTWGVLRRTGARFPYCGAKTEARSPKWSPAAARSVPGRPKRGLQVCMSRTGDGSRRLETATGFRVL